MSQPAPWEKNERIETVKQFVKYCDAVEHHINQKPITRATTAMLCHAPVEFKVERGYGTVMCNDAVCFAGEFCTCPCGARVCTRDARFVQVVPFGVVNNMLLCAACTDGLYS